MKIIDKLRLRYGTQYEITDVIVRYKWFKKEVPSYYIIVLQNEETGKLKYVKSISDRVFGTIHYWF